jgi:hypothetical protein
MSKKEQCKSLMSDYFGPGTAKLVDSMTEENCVEKCKAKFIAFLGEEEATVFDNIK